MADEEFVLDETDDLSAWTSLRDMNAKYGGPVWRPLAAPGSFLKIAPVANGLDYLVSVVDHLEPNAEGEPPSARDLKYAVLHLGLVRPIFADVGADLS